MAYQRGRYWHRSRRDSGHVLTDCIGSGDVGRYMAATENEWQARRAWEHAELIAGQLHSLTETALLASGYHKHSGTWRRARYEQLS
jgi:hypothetical protein